MTVANAFRGQQATTRLPIPARAAAFAALVSAGVGAGALVSRAPRIAGAAFVVVSLVLAWQIARRVIGRSLTTVALIGLLASTATTGRVFSYIRVGPLYISDAALIFIAGALTVRALAGGTLDVKALPLSARWAFAVYALLGCAAAARGLLVHADAYYVGRDAVLALYAMVSVITIILLPNRADVRQLQRVLTWSSIPATGFAALTLIIHDTGAIGVALGVYLAFFFLGSLASWTQGLTVSKWHWYMVALQLSLLLGLTVRTTGLAVCGAFLVLVVTGRPERRIPLAVAIMAAIAIVLTAVLVLPASVTRTGLVNQVHRQVNGAVAPSSSTREAANALWRIQFWQQDINAALRHPLTGVGFGPPANFCYQALCSDQRRTRDASEISGPHNSYVNVLFRMGFPGLIALLTLVFVAVRQAMDGLRAAVRRGDTVDILTIRLALATFTFVAITAFFAVALEGPFIGLFFWTFLGVLFVCGTPTSDTRFAVATAAENLLPQQREAMRAAFGVEPRQHYGLAETGRQRL